MSVWGVSMMRDESDVCVPVVRHMLAECDGVIVADNRSVDGTRQLLEEIADPALSVVDEPQVGYYQSDATMRLVGMAQDHGATWVVPFDADEWWYSPKGRIADVLETCRRETVVAAPSWEMIPTPDDGDSPDPFRRITTRRAVANTQKVAFRPGPGRVLDMGNHCLLPAGVRPGEQGWSSRVVGARSDAGMTLALLHYPYRTFDQLRRKVRVGKAALEATPYSAGIGFHWRELGAMDDERLSKWWAEWTKPEGVRA